MLSSKSADFLHHLAKMCLTAIIAIVLYSWVDCVSAVLLAVNLEGKSII